MNERPPKPKYESAPRGAGIDALERLVGGGVWDDAVKAELEKLLEDFREEFHLMCLMYRESGLEQELPEHERKIYGWLMQKFPEDSEEKSGK